MSRIIFFPIRHHSPACSHHLEQELRRLRPRFVLIEGPSDANSLIPCLTEEDLRLPVALYAYRQGDAPERIYYPLCEYSPEWTAIRVAKEIGAECRWIDLPSAAMLDQRGAESGEGDPLWESSAGRYTAELARRNGFDSFEDFWEARFEMDGYRMESGAFFESVGMYGRLLRSLEEEDGAVSSETVLRERFMTKNILSVLDENPEAPVAVVIGAAHLAPLERLVTNREAAEEEPEIRGPAEITLIPYSTLRLSEQSGYGAGNQAPRFYREVWQAAGDFSRVAKKTLVEQMEKLRLKGDQTNLSHAIEAGKLAHTLAIIRGKPAPGFREIIDATTSCYGEGLSDRLQKIWQETLIGAEVGTLPARTAQTPLQKEFYSEVQRLGLPLQDLPKTVQLRLTEPSDQVISVFLHRLRIAEIPYGIQQETMDAYRMLSAVREKWEVAWSPLTDARLIEQSAFGSTLAEVTAAQLKRMLDKASRVDQVTETLLNISLAQVDSLFPKALAQCEEMSAEDREFAALCRSALHLSTLLKYGTTRRLKDPDSLERLFEKLVLRAVWTLLPATAVDAEGAEEVMGALRILYETQRDLPQDVRIHLVRALEKAVHKTDAHPMIRGYSASLLYLMEEADEERIGSLLEGAIASAEKPEAAVDWIRGLFRLNVSWFIRREELIEVIHRFVMSMDDARFIGLLPMLRSVFSELSPMDRRYLEGTLSKVLQVDPGETRGLSSYLSRRDELAIIDRELAATVERWKSDYGWS
jgi:hypothetical protein